MIYANDFHKNDGCLRVHFIAHPANTGHYKTDAFVFEYNGSYTLIDGGINHITVCLEYLKRLRAELIGDRTELLDDESCKLKIDWMISHFHADHVSATIRQVMPCPFIEFNDIYLPPDCGIDQKYNPQDMDGDEKYRPKFFEKYETYCKSARIVELPFGKENAIFYENGDLRVDIYPPVADGGVGERLQLIIDRYYDGDDTIPQIPVAAVNACSMWVRVKLGEHSFLFTGDTIKRCADAYEALDEMTDAYADEIGHVTVLKFPHHGFKRDEGVASMLRFTPDFMVMTCEYATAPERIERDFPDCTSKIVNCGNETYIFETDGKTMSVSTLPVPEGCVREKGTPETDANGIPKEIN